MCVVSRMLSGPILFARIHVSSFKFSQPLCRPSRRLTFGCLLFRFWLRSCLRCVARLHFVSPLGAFWSIVQGLPHRRRHGFVPSLVRRPPRVLAFEIQPAVRPAGPFLRRPAYRPRIARRRPLMRRRPAEADLRRLHPLTRGAIHAERRGGRALRALEAGAGRDARPMPSGIWAGTGAVGIDSSLGVRRNSRRCG